MYQQHKIHTFIHAETIVNISFDITYDHGIYDIIFNQYNSNDLLITHKLYTVNLITKVYKIIDDVTYHMIPRKVY